MSSTNTFILSILRVTHAISEGDIATSDVPSRGYVGVTSGIYVGTSDIASGEDVGTSDIAPGEYVGTSDVSSGEYVGTTT